MGIEGDHKYLNPNVQYRIKSSVVQEKDDPLLNITILGRRSSGLLDSQTELERGVCKAYDVDYGKKEMWKLGTARLKWAMMVSFESRFVNPLTLFLVAIADYLQVKEKTGGVLCRRLYQDLM